MISLDLFPTFLAVASGDPHQALFSQRQNAAVRVGDWKLIHWVTRGSEVEQYNLKEDIGGRDDVAADHPVMVTELRERLAQWHSKNSERMW